ncbi:ATP/GTP-binding protein [Clostridium estertheticum]|uniref:AAA family ATPase n=1 Tax=Clostridium estertheticum TaxID=238834 RepID=UPI001C6E9A1D|nr:ATP-binding protein [Clostridium estertheticum]MBW9154519.1 ATP-binding protein [Clostridium estertheticum]WLC86408.1 ATP-binding protein [Clostridium estertheticum]
MLMEFSVENFLSIKDRVTLSMVASKDTSHKKNLIKNADKGINILNTAVIYGANASGKTTVLRGIGFLANFLNTSHEMQNGKKISVKPFRLDRACLDKPSSFEIIFKTEGIKYVYGFSVTKDKVIEEYLYYYPKGRQSIIFERENTDQYKFTNDIEIQTQIKNKFHSPNKLFLSTASLWEYKPAQIPFEWIDNNLQIIISHERLEEITADMMKENEIINKKVKYLIKTVVKDIEDITFTEIELNKKDNPLLKYLSEGAKSKLLSTNDNKLLSVNTAHKINNSQELVEFDLGEESDGTRKLFGILGPWVTVLEQGHTLIVDELDIRLHPHLTRFLVELFQNPDTNKKNAQLIFSTHDTNLLDQDLFRRDQIWFTEKKEDNSTDLYSLDDFTVRKDAAIEKGYLQGKYGAIPNMKGDCLWE